MRSCQVEVLYWTLEYQFEKERRWSLYQFDFLAIHAQDRLRKSSQHDRTPGFRMDILCISTGVDTVHSSIPDRTSCAMQDRIEAATMDLWNPYRSAMRALLPKARIIANKYHVVRQVNEVVETVRKSLWGSRSNWTKTNVKEITGLWRGEERDALLSL